MSRHHSTLLSNEPDPISLEHFDPKFGIMLNKKLYNGRHLVGHLSHGHTNVPHTRRPLTVTEYKKIMKIGGKTSRNDISLSRNPLGYVTHRHKKRLDAWKHGRTKVQTQQATALLAKFKRKFDAKVRRFEQQLIRNPTTGTTAIGILQDAIKKLDKSKDILEYMYVRF